MRLGEVGVLRGDDDDAVPELLVPLVIAQPVCDDVGLADVAAGVADSGLVVAEQEVDARALGFVALE